MKSSISAKIPTELYEEVQAAIKTEKYTSNTECIIEGLNLLLRNPDQEDIDLKTLLQEKEKEIQNLQNEVNCSKEEVRLSKEEIQSLQEEVNLSKEEVKRSKGVIQSLQEEVQRSKEEIRLSKEEVRLSKEEVNRSKEKYESQIQGLEDRLRTAPDPLEFAQLRARYEEIKEHNDTLKEELSKAERDKEDLKVTYANYFSQVQILINQKAIEAPGSKKPWWRFW